MSVARFPVYSQLDSAGGSQKGTVEIDRETKMVTVRPHKKHRVYTMPLDMVATMICQRIILNELHDEKKAKKAAKRTRAA
jgi:hypothetical protein